MKSERFDSAEELFQRAVDLPQAERSAFLDATCGSDSGLRRDVESLLSHFALAGPGFMRKGALGIPGAMDHLDKCPERIGRYRIIQKIGEGGMGVVYEARQESPSRTVAVKVVRPGTASRQLLRRFQREAEVLGRLQHSGIAQIFEAGTVDGHSGCQMFLAMEFVHGSPLTEYANSAGLGTPERLELLARICDAVQHAHQKGVIHRDIKPANILVDPTGQPKILDFGVAHITDSDVRLTAIETSVGQLIGTLPYMSPEQISGDPMEIDTRCDVYALGVLLYQLLTGRLPYDLANRSIPESARIIRDELPVRISAIDRSLRGDVETIILKSLEKDKARRYPSAANLAEDIRRYLSGMPIVARGDSALYVLRKQLKRYRGAVATGGLILAGVIAVAVNSYIQARTQRQLAQSEQQAKQEALAALEQAKEARRQADQTTARLQSELTISNVERGRLFGLTGNPATAEEFLWREFVHDPGSVYSYWALWELYFHEPCTATWRAHEHSDLQALVFTPDGRVLASAGSDGLVKLWDYSTHRAIATMSGHTGRIWAMSLSRTGILASAGTDGTTRLWDIASHALLRSLPSKHGEYQSVAFSPDGTKVVTCGSDGRILIWKSKTGELESELTGHAGGTTRAIYSPDGRLLASSGSDGTIQFWQNGKSPSIATLRGHTAGIATLAFSPDGTTLASGGGDRTIRLWHVTNETCLEVLEAPNGTVRSVAFSPDGKTLASAGWWSVDQWDIDMRRRRESFPIPSFAAPLVYSPDGTSLVTGLFEESIKVWDVSTDRGLRRLGPHSGRSAASFSRDGQLIATGDGVGNVRIWNSSNRELVSTLAGHRGRVRTLAFNPKLPLLATGCEDRRLRMWNTLTWRNSITLEDHYDVTNQAIDFSPDGTLLASTCAGGFFRVRDASTGREKWSQPNEGDEPLGVHFSPDGHHLATVDRGKAIRLWNTTDGTLAASIPAAQAWSVGFSPDGRRLVWSGWMKTIEVWDLSGPKLRARLDGHRGLVSAVQFRPGDPNTIISASADGTVKLWDIDGCRCLATLRIFGGWDAITAAFSSDGNDLLLASARGEVALCDLSYYDRRINGNLRYQLDRLRSGLGESISNELLLRWRSPVGSQPFP